MKKVIIMLVVAISCCACHEAPTRQVRQDLRKAYTEYRACSWLELDTLRINQNLTYEKFLEAQTYENWEVYLTARKESSQAWGRMRQTQKEIENLENTLSDRGWSQKRILRLEVGTAHPRPKFATISLY